MENKINNMQIPKIIHQVWEVRTGEAPGSILLHQAETWKIENPGWEYRFWNFTAIDKFLLDYFPLFINNYNSFRYDVQRWDAIRYLILFKFGGVYADLDYECLESLDWLPVDKNCCMGLDSQEHSRIFRKSYIISNAFMATVPRHPYFQRIIDEISNVHSDAPEKFNYVLETTGPYMVTRLYESYNDKEQIWLIPFELTSPISKNEVAMIINGKANRIIAKKIDKAYAAHYFFSLWYANENNIF